MLSDINTDRQTNNTSNNSRYIFFTINAWKQCKIKCKVNAINKFGGLYLNLV